MKKICAILILFATVLSLFAGCQSTEPDPNVLSTIPPSKEVCMEIFLTLLDMGKHADGLRYADVGVEYGWYYGTINGCIVALGEVASAAVPCYWEVAGCTFGYGSGFEILVYRNGEACQLQEAYENGWLTEEHIKQLEERHMDMWGAIRWPSD